MIATKKSFMLFFFGILSVLVGIAQERNWTIQTSKDGQVQVKSEVVDAVNSAGEEIKIMHYIAEKVGHLTLEQAENYLRNSENYLTIWESTLETREVRKISENEWVTYFLYDSFWPMPKSDCVQQYTFLKNSPNSFTIVAKAIHDEGVKSDVKRLEIFDVKYEVEKVNSAELKLTLSVSTSPAINAPKILFKPWFPKGPAGIVTRIFEHAAKQH